MYRFRMLIFFFCKLHVTNLKVTIIYSENICIVFLLIVRTNLMSYWNSCVKTNCSRNAMLTLTVI